MTGMTGGCGHRGMIAIAGGSGNVVPGCVEAREGRSESLIAEQGVPSATLAIVNQIKAGEKGAKGEQSFKRSRGTKAERFLQRSPQLGRARPRVLPDLKDARARNCCAQSPSLN